MLPWLLLALVAGSLVYCVLTIIAAVRYRAVQPAPLRVATPISVLKQTDSACRPAMKRIVWQQTWRGLQGWTYLILDFPVGVGPRGLRCLTK